MLLVDMLIMLTIAVCIAAAFKRFQLPPVVGYLCTGLIVGPYGMGWFANTSEIQTFAELGVVFLLFTVGLEFSLPRLMAMKKQVIIGGALQVSSCIFISMLLGVLIGLTSAESVIVGCIIAMSSTSIVIKQLSEQMELNTLHGRSALAILLFQDLAAIPILILIPTLSVMATGDFFQAIFLAFLKGAVVIVMIILIGRWLLRPIFHEIARMRSPELFTFVVLLVAVGCAYLTNIFNLSYVLGAFLAGMLLGETEYRHQIDADIRPFRDILLALFFISIGMLFDFRMLTDIWPWVLLLLLGLVIFKGLLIAVINLALGYNRSISVRTGLVLAQGSEFGFAILSLTMIFNLLSFMYSQVILAALVLSIILAPFIIRYNAALTNVIVPKANWRSVRDVVRHVATIARGRHNHIVICGYGRVGQNIARLLDLEKIDYVAVDLDPLLIQSAREAGEHVSYGNATHHNILEATGLRRACALVISFADMQASVKVLEQAHHIHPGIPILVRAHDEHDLAFLRAHGAVEVIPETLETSLILAAHLLIIKGVPASRVLQHMRIVRSNRYQLLREVFTGGAHYELETPTESLEELYPVTLTETAFAVGLRVMQLPLNELGVELHGLLRGGIKMVSVDPKLLLQAGDVLILYGPLVNLERAEEFLLQG
jgi:CPA2 family monovalent cation:H+ antiporter-2